MICSALVTFALTAAPAGLCGQPFPIPQTPTGLMVPIVKDADKKGLAAIAAEVKELAGRVRRAGALTARRHDSLKH